VLTVQSKVRVVVSQLITKSEESVNSAVQEASKSESDGCEDSEPALRVTVLSRAIALGVGAGARGRSGAGDGGDAAIGST